MRSRPVSPGRRSASRRPDGSWCAPTSSGCGRRSSTCSSNARDAVLGAPARRCVHGPRRARCVVPARPAGSGGPRSPCSDLRGTGRSVRIVVPTAGSGMTAEHDGPHLRALLHHQADRLRHRARHHAQHRRGARRHDRSGARPAGRGTTVRLTCCRDGGGVPEPLICSLAAAHAGLHPARRRRGEDPRSAGARAASRTRAMTSSRSAAPREARGCSASASSTVLVVDNLMPELTGLDLIRELSGDGRRGRAAADSHDDGARHRRERHRGDEARRARLSAEAVRDRRAAGRRRRARSSTSACARSTTT